MPTGIGAVLMKKCCCLRTQKNVCKHRKQQAMDDQFLYWVESAKSARPVAAAEHEHSTDDCSEAEEQHPHHIRLKQMLCLELRGMIENSNCSRCHVHITDDGDRQWSLVHKIGCVHNFAALADEARLLEDLSNEPHRNASRMAPCSIRLIECGPTLSRLL